MGDLIEEAEVFHGFGLNVFLWDYRGYGKSRGIPTEKGTYRDARAAYEVVRARHGGVEHPPVLVVGRSLGGAVAVQLALDRPVSGLVLESTFTSALDVARVWYPTLPVQWMIRYRYESIRKIGSITAPLLLAHSPDDETIPYAHGQALYEAARAPKRFIQLRGSHQEVGWRETPGYRDALQTFAREHIGGIL